MADNDFDPDAYLANQGGTATATDGDDFTPESYLATDPNYDPFAAANAKYLQTNDPNDPEIDTAAAVQKLRDAMPRDQQVQYGFAPSRGAQLAAVPGQIGKFVAGLPTSVALNTASVGANAPSVVSKLSAAFPNASSAASIAFPALAAYVKQNPDGDQPSAAAQKLQSDAVIAEQGALQPLAGVGKRLWHWFTNLESEDKENEKEDDDEEEYGPQAVAEDKADYSASQEPYTRDMFLQEAQDRAVQQANAKGQASDQGLYSDVSQSLPGGGDFKPSDVTLSPEQQKTLGVEDVPGEDFARQSAATVQDPTNIAFALAPEVPGVGKVLQGAGKVGEFLAKPAEVVSDKLPGYSWHAPIRSIPSAVAKTALSAFPAAADFVSSAGDLASGIAPEEGASALGIRAKRALAGGVGGAAIGGGAALAQDQDPVAGAESGAAFGLAGGALHDIRPIQQAGAAEAMATHGADLSTGNEAVDAKHDEIMQNFSPEVQDNLNRIRSALSGDGTNLVLTDQKGFNDALASNGIGPAEQARGVYQPNDQHLTQENPDGTSTVYLNTNSIGGYSGVGPLDAAGHETGHAILDYLQKQGASSAANDLRQSVESNLTPQEKQQIATAYSKDLSGNTNGAITTGNPIDENIAEITRKVLNNEDISNFALPKPLTEKIKDSINGFFGEQRGDSAGMQWGTKEINSAKRQVRDALYDQGQRAAQMRQRARDVASGKVQPNIQERQTQIQTRLGQIGSMSANQVTPDILREREGLLTESQDLTNQENARQGRTPPAPETPKTAPAAAGEPVAPAPTAAPEVDRSAVEATLTGLGYPKRVAKQTASVAEGNSVEKMTKDALSRLAKPTQGDIRKPNDLSTITPQAETTSGPLEAFGNEAGGKAAGLAKGLGEMGSGSMDSLYSKLLDSLQKGDLTELGKPSKVLQDAKPAFDAGLIKTPADLKSWIGGDPQMKRKLAELQAGQLSNFPTNDVQGKPEDENESNGGVAVASEPAEASPETSGSQVQVAALPSSEDVQAALGSATDALQKTPEWEKAVKKGDPAKIKSLQDGAHREAIENLLPQVSDGEQRPENGLYRFTNAQGETDIRGKVNPDNPAEKALMSLGGMSDSDVSNLQNLQSGNGVRYIDYGSAAELPGEHSKEQRDIEQAESTAQQRVEGTGAITEQKNKAVIPIGNKVTKDNRVNAVVYSPDKILSNANFVLNEAKNQGQPTGGYESAADPQFLRDLQTYLENHKNGYSGNGLTKLSDANPDAVGQPFRDAQGKPVDPETAQERQDVINMAMHDTRSTAKANTEDANDKYQADMEAWEDGGKKGVKPRKPRAPKSSTIAASQEAMSLAAFGEGHIGEGGETNALRENLKAGGFDPSKVLETPVETLRPELIRDIRDSPNGAQEIVRPHGVEPEDIGRTVTNPPNSKAVAAGFMPSNLSDFGSEDEKPTSKSFIGEKSGAASFLPSQSKDQWTRAYHGSIGGEVPTDFTKREVMFFSPKEDIAKEYAGNGKTGAFNVKLGKTLDASSAKDILRELPKDLRDRHKNDRYSWEVLRDKDLPDLYEDMDVIDALRDKGYDSATIHDDVVHRNGALESHGVPSYAIFNHENIEPHEDGNNDEALMPYSSSKSFIGGKGLASFMPSGDQDELGFYSHAANVIADKIPNKAKPDQIIATLKGAGVKPDEIENMGLPEFLKTHDGPVSKQELQDFAKAGGVQMKEVQKEATEDTKFGQYQLPGGTNYKEVLLTLPERAEDKRYAYLDGKYRSGTMTPAESEEMTRLENSPPTEFRSSHWDEPNVLAHIRQADHTDTEGNKVRLIEEIQSDWHQKGRKEGYSRPLTPDEESQASALERQANEKREQAKSIEVAHVDKKAIGKAVGVDKNLVGVNASMIQERFADVPEVKEWIARNHMKAESERLKAEARDLDIQARNLRTPGNVPDAPFKKTWAELAFKRALKMAVDDGMDKIAWTPGEQQAARYDLSKQVGLLSYNPKTERLLAYSHGNDVLTDQTVPKDKLSDFVGKDASEKLMQAEPTAGGNLQLKGPELKMGGEGMRGFYDKILPDFVKKYVKKWGATVGESNLENGHTVRSVPITDEMRKAVMAGQPMFLPKGDSSSKSFIGGEMEPRKTWFMRDGQRIYHTRHPLNGQFVSPNQTLANFGVSAKKDDDE